MFWETKPKDFQKINFLLFPRVAFFSYVVDNVTEEDENRNLLMKEMFCSFDYHNTDMVYMIRHPYVKLFLSRLEKELFMFFPMKPPNYNLTREEWQQMRNLAENWSIIVKPADKGLCVVIWNREDYLPEGCRQVSDISQYTDVKRFNQKLLSDLTKNSSRIFKKLHNNKLIIEKELKYFSYSFKNACCLGKIYLLPKIYKKLYDVLGRPVIPTTGLLQKE